MDVLLTDAVGAGVGRPSLAEILGDAGFTSEPATHGTIWQNDPATGEKIEFFVPHIGPIKKDGGSRDVPGQHGVGAIPLVDVELLAAHTRTLQVPLAVPGIQATNIGVRLPSLGAYLVIKASTFASRTSTSGGQAGPRRAKDVVYIRDVMAAGDEVVDQVERDIAELREQGSRMTARMRTASNHLSLLQGESDILHTAAAELAERDSMTPRAARLDLQGHVADLRDILESSGP